MSDRILINGVDKIALYFEGSLRALRDIGHMNSCTLQLVTDANAYLPTEGVDLEVRLNDDTQFCGVIKSVGIERLDRSTANTSQLLITIDAENFRDVASRRTISGTWESPDYTCAGDIVQNIVTHILSADDVGVSRIDDGTAIELFSVVVRSVDQILDDLAEISGYKWYISDDKDLVFTDNDPDVTDFRHIDSTDPAFTDFEVVSYVRDTTEYANKIFIRGGIGDDGYQYTDVLSDDVEIAARAAIEGGTGAHGYVIDNPEIVDAAMGLEAMTAELAKRSRVPQTLVFKSRQAFEPGFKILVKLPAFGVSSTTTFMIEQVTITEQAGELSYQVSATYKNPTMTTTHRVPGAKEFFEGLIGGSSGSVAGVTSTITKYLNNIIASTYGQNSAQIVVDTTEDLLATATLTTTWVTGISNSTIILGSTVAGTPSQDCKLTIRIFVDGAAQVPVNEHVCYGLVKESTAFTIAVPIPAGDHTIQLQAVVDQGTFTVDALGAQFWALAVGVGVGVAVDYFPKINLSLVTPEMPVIPDETSVLLPGHPYQEWTNYSDSPVTNAEFPHQLIITDGTTTKLFVSTLPLFVDGVAVYASSGSISKGYEPLGLTWNLSNPEQYSLTPRLFGYYWSIVPKEANKDVFTSDSLSVVYFSKTTTPAQDGNETSVSSPNPNATVLSPTPVSISETITTPDMPTITEGAV